MESIIQIVKELRGTEPLYFDTPLLVKATPHSVPCTLWGACVSPQNELWLMDSYQEWHKLESTDRNYSLVVASLHQRLGYLLYQNQKRA